MSEVTVRLPEPHEKQLVFIESNAKRKVVKVGRRGGKTVGCAIIAVQKFLEGKRVLYAAPTEDQIGRFWFEVINALQEPIEAGVFYKNETKHIISYPSLKTVIETNERELKSALEARIRAKTAFNADTLRGDYADFLILDEWQLINEDAWAVVGAPMLLDNNGDAVFCFTPPSLHSRSVSKADDPRHAAKLFKKAQQDTTGRWETFHFTSHDNPHLSKDALRDITSDMTQLAIRQEILAEDIDEAAGALWKRNTIEDSRLLTHLEMEYIVVAVDPSATSEGDEAGIIVAGRAKGEYYLLGDYSLQGSPQTWASKVVNVYKGFQANTIIAESNQGGEMVSAVINQVDKNARIELVHASRGKATRAEPIAAAYEQGRVHHIGSYPALEDEMCLWCPGDRSPNRMDAMVWAFTALIEGGVKAVVQSEKPDIKIVYRDNDIHNNILNQVKKVRYENSRAV